MSEILTAQDLRLYHGLIHIMHGTCTGQPPFYIGLSINISTILSQHNTLFNLVAEQ